MMIASYCLPISLRSPVFGLQSSALTTRVISVCASLPRGYQASTQRCLEHIECSLLVVVVDGVVNPLCPRSIYPGKLMGTGITMADLARMLEPFTEQRTVRDRTGLTGRYDVE